MTSPLPFEAEDYAYDYKDRVVLLTAFEELKEANAKGYRYGLITFAASYVILNKSLKWTRNTKGLAALVTGVSASNLYTHKARSYYAHAASNFNRKTSIALNSMMS